MSTVLVACISGRCELQNLMRNVVCVQTTQADMHRERMSSKQRLAGTAMTA